MIVNFKDIFVFNLRKGISSFSSLKIKGESFSFYTDRGRNSFKQDVELKHSGFLIITVRFVVLLIRKPKFEQ